MIRRPIVVMALRAAEIRLVKEDCATLRVAVLPCRLRQRGRAFGFQSFLQVLAGGNGSVADDRDCHESFENSDPIRHVLNPTCYNEQRATADERLFYHPARDACSNAN